MEIREIIYIKTIADFGNLTKAANHLHITQPSLSQSLKNIESNIGVELFERSKRGMILTEAGQRFISDASSVLYAYNEFVKKIERYNKTSINKHIGLYKLSYTTPINNLVMNYIALHNDDNYVIKVDSIPILEEMVLENKLDLAIIKYSPIYKRNSNLTYEVLFTEKLYGILNRDHPLANKKSIKVSELEGNSLITSDPTEYPHKMVEEVLNRAGINLNIHTHTNYQNLSMIFDLVGQGLGITFGTEYVCDYFDRDDIVKVALEEEYLYEVCIVQNKRNTNNKEFIDFIKSKIGK